MSNGFFFGIGIAPASPSDTTVPVIEAANFPVTVDLDVGQSLSEHPFWETYKDPLNYRTAQGETIISVTINFLGTTSDESEPFTSGGLNHFSVTVMDSTGNPYTFVTLPRTLPGDPPPSSIHVFLVAGQSNSTSRAPFDSGEDWPAGVFQWGRYGPSDGQLIAASRPLEHHSQPIADGAGWALQFVLDYMAANPNIHVVLVPCGQGGSGFSDDRWNPGDDLYQDAVSRVNALMAANPSYQFEGVLWHQGERDAQRGTDAINTYPARLETMIEQMRTDIAAATDETPFVLGGMVPSWVAADPDRQVVQSAIEAVPSRLSHTGYASSAGGADQGDGLHFDMASFRMLGSRYASALDAAKANVIVPVTDWSITGTVITSAPPVPAPNISGTLVS